MTTFVLVAGMWLGASAWRDVVRELEAAGHEAWPFEPRMDAGADLTAHADGVIDLIERNGLRDVVLVGHSYGGMVVSTAAGRIADRVARVVYVDSGPLPEGMSQFDTTPPEAQEATRASLVDGLVPVPDHLAHEGRPHPFASVTEGVRYAPGYETLPQALVSCMFPADQVREMIASGHPFFAKLAGAEVVELPGDHWPMFDRAAALARVLEQVARG